MVLPFLSLCPNIRQGTLNTAFTVSLVAFTVARSPKSPTQNEYHMSLSKAGLQRQNQQQLQQQTSGDKTKSREA